MHLLDIEHSSVVIHQTKYSEIEIRCQNNAQLVEAKRDDAQIFIH